MKKTDTNGFSKKILYRIMKIYALLLFVTMAELYAVDVKGQNVTLNVNDTELKTVFTEIENLTEFNFFYNNSLIDVSKKVTLNVDNQELKQVLVQLFKGTDIDYRLLKDQIVLFPSDDNEMIEKIEKLIKEEYSDNENSTVNIEAFIEEVIQNEVRGTVVDSDGNPLPGVSILISGTTTGTESDFDGNYILQASAGDVLEFSFIGMKTQSITVGDSNTVNVTLLEDASQLDEVVVTALGVKRQKKSLTYATQKVETETIDEARQTNVVNSLSGRVAGISVQQAGTGVSGASKVVLRGNRSIAGSSQPLYVVDGVALGGDISDLSPDDIASINVLKGANAAAIYGSRANNGAIIITTKGGSEDRIRVDLSSTLTVENANILFDYQNQYGQGSGGTYAPGSLGSWGPALDGSSVAHWSPDPSLSGSQIPYSAQSNNVEDFFETGVSFSNNVSISSGSERNQTFFGYTNDSRKGIVSGNELMRHNISLKVDNKLLKDKLTLSAKLNYIRSDVDNQLDTGESFANPLRHAYRLPRNIRTSDVSNFQYADSGGNVLQNYWDPGNNGGANPYWTINKNLNEIETNRVIAYASLNYEFSENLSLLVRSAVDQNSQTREDRDHNNSYIIADNGNYLTNSSKNVESNSDFLLSYKRDLNENFSFDVQLGGNHRYTEFKSVSTNNGGLNAPNIFAISNASNLTASQVVSEKMVNSLYGFGQAAFKDAVFFDLTYRSDWSSTLPADNQRFDYYSLGLSAVLTDLFKMPELFSFLKVRASYAEVGNDTDPYQLLRTANLVSGGFIQLSNSLPNADLKPERTTSLEAGFDARFLDSRLGVDFSFYKSNSIDQLFAQGVTTATLTSSRFVNGADVQNTGVEVMLTGTPIRNTDFTWDITFNYAQNDSEVLELAGGLESLSYGGDFLRRFELNVGEEWGNVYSRGFLRDDQGRAIVAADGTPEVTSGQSVLVANYNPDWVGGISNTFKYKNFNLSFLIDIRQGGEVVSFTNTILSSDGALEKTLAGRDGSLLFGTTVFAGEDVVKADGTPNDITTNAEAFWGKIGGRNSPVGEAFVEDASNVRMREMVLGYNFSPKSLESTPFERVKLSLVGRNLFFISNSASIDPEVVTNTDTAADGFESFAPPSTTSFGLNLKLGF